MTHAPSPEHILVYPTVLTMWGVSFAGFLAFGAPLLAWDYLTRKTNPLVEVEA